MKKLSARAIILFGLIFSMSGCKKGEKDPAISLLTRKARLVGEWKMTKGYSSFTSVQTAKSGVSYYLQFDGSNYTGTETPIGSAAFLYKGNYSLTLSVLKDGSFALKEQWDSNVLSATGNWNFSSRVGEDKNKEGIVMVITSVSADASNKHLFNKFSTEFTYKLVQLKNKEIIMESGTPTYLNSNGDHESFQNNYTFTQ